MLLSLWIPFVSPRLAVDPRPGPWRRLRELCGPERHAAGRTTPAGRRLSDARSTEPRPGHAARVATHDRHARARSIASAFADHKTMTPNPALPAAYAREVGRRIHATPRPISHPRPPSPATSDRPGDTWKTATTVPPGRSVFSDTYSGAGAIGERGSAPEVGETPARHRAPGLVGATWPSEPTTHAQRPTR